jgi:hypothetical protein
MISDFLFICADICFVLLVWLSKKCITVVIDKAKKNNMCVYGHPTHPIFQPPTLTFFIGNYSTLIFTNDRINFYTEFG